MNQDLKLLQRGFSLIEVLVTISILVVIGVFVSLTLSGTFTGNTKTDLISTIKQNGQNAMNQMELDIRDAESVVCPTTSTGASPASVITVQSKTAGTYVRYSYCAQGQACATSTYPNGYLRKETFVVPAAPTDAAFLINMCSLGYVTNQKTSADLIDRNSQNAVSVKNVTGSGFSLIRRTGSKDIVTVQFDLGPGTSSGIGFENNLGSSTNSFSFKTTIQLR